jgi:hypothetical protein
LDIFAEAAENQMEEDSTFELVAVNSEQ